MRVLFEVPRLVVGFDVETTGLDIHHDEPIAYGFAELTGEAVSTRQFFALPSVQVHPGAERVHGYSYEHLRAMHRRGEALSSTAGAVRAARTLAQYASRGAMFVGANPQFDFMILDGLLQRTLGTDLAFLGVPLERLDILDIVVHDRVIDPDHAGRPRRGLSALCHHYSVTPGGHDAARDARASVEVLVRQVEALRVSLRHTLTAADCSVLSVDRA